MPVTRYVLALLLGGLGACGGSPAAERTRPSAAPALAAGQSAPLPPPLPGGPPRPQLPVSAALTDSVAPATAARPAGLFAPDIDARIAGAAPGQCPLREVYEQVAHRALPEPGESRMAAWSPWLTDYCPLRDYADEAADPATPYARPVRLPTRAGRLFLVRAATPWRPSLLLLEFGAARYRFVWLGEQQAADFGGEARHRLYRSPGAELLALQSVEGYMGAGRCASGSANTWLQVWDVRRGTCLLSTPIGWYFTLFGCEDDDGTEHAGGDLTATRRWALRDHGRTLWLGNYRVEGERPGPHPGLARYQVPRPTRRLRDDLNLQPEDAARSLPAGTYHLAGGRYRRAR